MSTVSPAETIRITRRSAANTTNGFTHLQQDGIKLNLNVCVGEDSLQRMGLHGACIHERCVMRSERWRDNRGGQSGGVQPWDSNRVSIQPLASDVEVGQSSDSGDDAHIIESNRAVVCKGQTEESSHANGDRTIRTHKRTCHGRGNCADQCCVGCRCEYCAHDC